MGVYIDMEMPKKTYAHCMLIKDIDGSVQLHVCTKNSEEISEWEFYDLVHVPEPHGRLIDADALHKLFEDQWHYLQVLDWNENPTAEAKQSGISWCINTMHDDAPIIIPASEDEIDEAQRDYQVAADYQQYCEMYEQTYDPETGTM